jgi:hypothetical protein
MLKFEDCARIEDLSIRLEEVKKIFEEAMKKAVESVEAANKELKKEDLCF